MSFNDNLPKLKPFKRSVSIIGVGATPFVRILDDPSVDGMNEQELFAYAARDAMKDAGVDGSDEKKSESIETQVTLIKEFIQKHNENPDKEYEIAVYDIYSDMEKPEQILTDRDLNG